MNVQASYSATQRAGYPGMVRTMGTQNPITRIATAVTAFGLAVSQGDEGKFVKGGAKFIGVTIADATLPVTNTLNSYEAGQNAAIHTSGEIFVTAGEDVDAGDIVHYDTTSGLFSKSGGTAVTGAMWVKGAVEGAVGCISFGIQH